MAADFTMADVARAAGLSRQAVYLHFPDRAGLLRTLLIQAGGQGASADMERAPSARAALTAVVARLAEVHPKAWPVVRASGGSIDDDSLYDPASFLAERFRAEGALAPHLSTSTAADLLCALLSLAMWKELVIGCGWDSARYKSHIAFLAASAVTR